MPLGRVIEREGATPLYECSECLRSWHSEQEAVQCCSHECEECGALHMYPEDAHECCATYYYCEHCGRNHETEEAAINCCQEARIELQRQSDRRRLRAEYPREILLQEPGYVIAIPDIPGRPARPTSIEQELSDGAWKVAMMAYEMQLSQHNRVVNYSADAPPGEIVVKEDGSLDRTYGGEALYSRFQLHAPSHVNRFSKAVWNIRTLRNQGLVKTSRNAGLHIHIGIVPSFYTGGPRTDSMENVFGPAQMAALYEIFTFCEDVLFCIAAAGWSSHRGTRYAQLLPKEEKMNAGKLAKNATRGRHFSLNFQRLLNAVKNCICGACAVGDWGECECGAVQNGTVEWRIFNATTKPETLHAWLLLAHAITAKSFDYTLGELQPNGYQDTEHHKHSWILGWILNECPLLPEEREVILATAKRSPNLHVDWDELEQSIELPGMTDSQGDDDLYADSDDNEEGEV